MNDTYNQIIINRASTSVDYVLECAECQEHNNYDVSGVSNACMLCSEFTPKEINLPLSGIVVAIFLVSSFFLIKSFIRK